MPYLEAAAIAVGACSLGVAWEEAWVDGWILSRVTAKPKESSLLWAGGQTFLE